jgi:hypothetical protein
MMMFESCLSVCDCLSNSEPLCLFNCFPEDGRIGLSFIVNCLIIVIIIIYTASQLLSCIHISITVVSSRSTI